MRRSVVAGLLAVEAVVFYGIATCSLELGADMSRPRAVADLGHRFAVASRALASRARHAVRFRRG